MTGNQGAVSELRYRNERTATKTPAANNTTPNNWWMITRTFTPRIQMRVCGGSDVSGEGEQVAQRCSDMVQPISDRALL